MSNITTRGLFEREDVRKKFSEMLGKRSTSFITSVLQIVASNQLLKQADPSSVYQSAAMAATLDLPLNNNLGFAYIVPYNTRQKDGSYKVLAQFQIGYKGFIQLAIRSGQFKSIEVCKAYEDDTEEEIYTRLTSIFKKEKEGAKAIGYASYFKLLNGFEKSYYMSIEDLQKHAGRFSKTKQKGYGLWVDDFDSMGSKTVLKMLLSKYAPLSVDMQTAVSADQSVIENVEEGKFSYVDNEDDKIDVELVVEQKEQSRIAEHINKAVEENDYDALMMAEHHLSTPELQSLFDNAKTKIIHEQQV